MGYDGQIARVLAGKSIPQRTFSVPSAEGERWFSVRMRGLETRNGKRTVVLPAHGLMQAMAQTMKAADLG